MTDQPYRCDHADSYQCPLNLCPARMPHHTNHNCCDPSPCCEDRRHPLHPCFVGRGGPYAGEGFRTLIVRCIPVKSVKEQV